MNDIEERSDIILLVKRFYDKLMVDDVVGYLFTDIAQINLEQHLPILHDFWETMLLDNMIYQGNPMKKHLALNLQEKLLPQHFERWLMHWETTVNENFAGESADKAIERARNIAVLMQYKVEQE
jgi:hemoglobin